MVIKLEIHIWKAGLFISAHELLQGQSVKIELCTDLLLPVVTAAKHILAHLSPLKHSQEVMPKIHVGWLHHVCSAHGRRVYLTSRHASLLERLFLFICVDQTGVFCPYSTFNLKFKTRQIKTCSSHNVEMTKRNQKRSPS